MPPLAAPLGRVVGTWRRDLAVSCRRFPQLAYLWAPILIATCILVTVNLLTRDRSPVHESRQILARLENIPRNLYSYALYLSFPIPFAAVWLAMRWRKATMLLVLPAIPALTLHFTMFQSRSLAQEWPTAAALYGLATLVFMIHQYARARDRVGMLLSLWVLIPVPVAIYFQFPIKYMLGVMPAVVLILIRTLSVLPRAREVSAYAALVLVCATFSCVLLRADADFAEYGRRAATELIAPHVAAGEKVWYGAGQWGLRERGDPARRAGWVRGHFTRLHLTQPTSGGQTARPRRRQ